MKDSRKFYEEFLGLECVRHALPAMVIRCGLKFHIVCVEVGDNVHPLNVLNHWGIDVESREKVDEAYQNALKYQEAYKIKQVMKPNLQHGVYSFYLEDLEPHNWWEVQSIDGFQHDDMFDFRRSLHRQRCGRCRRARRIEGEEQRPLTGAFSRLLRWRIENGERLARSSVVHQGGAKPIARHRLHFGLR